MFHPPPPQKRKKKNQGSHYILSSHNGHLYTTAAKIISSVPNLAIVERFDCIHYCITLIQHFKQTKFQTNEYPKPIIQIIIINEIKLNSNDMTILLWLTAGITSGPMRFSAKMRKKLLQNVVWKTWKRQCTGKINSC